MTALEIESPSPPRTSPPVLKIYNWRVPTQPPQPPNPSLKKPTRPLQTPKISPIFVASYRPLPGPCSPPQFWSYADNDLSLELSTLSPNLDALDPGEHGDGVPGASQVRLLPLRRGDGPRL